MPIKLPSNLPAFDVLKEEGVMVMSEYRAARQDIRPLRIGLLNLMPKKIQTENQFARLVGSTPLQIELLLIRMTNHHSKNIAVDHMNSFYRSFKEIFASDEKFDGLIITGAPVEHLRYEEVDYWEELKKVFDWTQTHVNSTIGVCWAGMAMLKYFHDLEKHKLSEKAFGCFSHRLLLPTSHYLRGFADTCFVPVSRWTEIKQTDLESKNGLQTLLCSDEVGPCLVQDKAHKSLYVFNHFEYDSDTLQQEYQRDRSSRTFAKIPVSYFPENDPTKTPENHWRSHAHLLYGNWINEIYQTTPYHLDAIGS